MKSIDKDSEFAKKVRLCLKRDLPHEMEVRIDPYDGLDEHDEDLEFGALDDSDEHSKFNVFNFSFEHDGRTLFEGELVLNNFPKDGAAYLVINDIRVSNEPSCRLAGKGLGRLLTRNIVDLAKLLGATHISGQGVSTGYYVWQKFGFKAAEYVLPKIKEELLVRVEEERGSIPDEDIPIVEALIHSIQKPEDLWALADSKYGKQIMVIPETTSLKGYGLPSTLELREGTESWNRFQTYSHVSKQQIDQIHGMLLKQLGHSDIGKAHEK